MASSVEWSWRKPNCIGWKNDLASSSAASRACTRCSKVRMMIDVTEIGRNDDGSDLAPLPLYSAITLASVHCWGSAPWVQEYVKTAAKASYMPVPACLRRMGKTVSQPGAEAVGCRLHCSATSAAVNVQPSLT